MTSRYSAEFVAHYQTRYPELYDRVMSCETPAELTKVVRATIKAMDAGTLDIPACDGAIEVFKTVKREEFTATRECSRSLDEIRADRILHTGARTANGRKVARRW